jgi:hypothetical protein
MELSMIEKPARKDLRVMQHDFCTLWKCERRDSKTPCVFCPVAKDVLDMGREMRMSLPAWKYFIVL